MISYLSFVGALIRKDVRSKNLNWAYEVMLGKLTIYHFGDDNLGQHKTGYCELGERIL